MSRPSKKFYLTKKFKKLQKLWNQKLRDSGFEDIEEEKYPDLLKSWQSHYFFIRYTPEQIEEGLDYFKMATHFYWNFANFENKRDKEIWRLHSEGIPRRRITDIINALGFNISDSSVQLILADLKEIMHTQLWISKEDRRNDAATHRDYNPPLSI